jgi:hypothetical protein
MGSQSLGTAHTGAARHSASDSSLSDSRQMGIQGGTPPRAMSFDGGALMSAGGAHGADFGFISPGLHGQLLAAAAAAPALSGPWQAAAGGPPPIGGGAGGIAGVAAQLPPSELPGDGFGEGSLDGAALEAIAQLLEVGLYGSACGWIGQ